VLASLSSSFEVWLVIYGITIAKRWRDKLLAGQKEDRKERQKLKEEKKSRERGFADDALSNTWQTT
jgi:hypothetical protein